MWFIGVEAEQETSAPPPKKNPGSAPVKNAHPFGTDTLIRVCLAFHGHIFRICECMSCRLFSCTVLIKSNRNNKTISAKPA